jgi:MFS family permease
VRTTIARDAVGRVAPGSELQGDSLTGRRERREGASSPAFAAFQHRDFTLFWSAALVSNSASWMQMIAVTARLKELTGSNTWVGAAAMAGLVPSTLLTPLAGLLADRVSRRLILITTQLLQMIFAFGFFGLHLAGWLTPWRMLALLAGTGCVAGVQIAAWQSFVPTLVPRTSLVDAVRLNSVQFQAARALGPGFGALAVGFLGIGAAFLVNAVTYIPVILAVVIARPRQLIAHHSERDLLGDLVEGFRFTLGNTILRRTVITSFIVSVFGQSLVQLAAGIATDVYGRQPAANGALVAAAGIGSLATGFWLIGWGERVARSRVAMYGLGGYVVGVVLTVVTRNFAVGLIAFFVCGLSHIPIATSLNTFLQSAVPDEIRGRVLSLYLVGVMLGTPIGSFGLGKLSDLIGMREVLLIDAVAFLAFFTIAATRFARYREIDNDTIDDVRGVRLATAG